MRSTLGSWLVLCAIWAAVPVSAQTDSTRPLKIAVFAPVYLDSMFTNMDYKIGKANLPRYVLPGLDFYNGVMLAIDSLNTDKAPVEVLFYDSKSAAESLDEILIRSEMNDVSLIIAAFNTRNEVKPLADFALEHTIPLISSVYPNDGGVTANPYFVLINPTLRTHIEAIYRYMHRTYPTDNITIFRRKGGGIEDMVQSVLTDMNKRTPGIPLKLKTVELPDDFTPDQVIINLDSTRRNVLICASLNEAFGASLVKAVGSAKNFPSVIMGMPTWDGIKDLGKDADIIYTTPYNLMRTDKVSQQLTTKYRAKYSGRPSDMVFKGFESMYHFTRLLLKHGPALVNNLSDKDYKLFNEFDIQPVRTARDASVPDYLENKKIYFVHKVDTRVKSVN
ncbi:MAG: LysM-repeat protein and domain [Sediminibacterium sp.]|nr:LysM-repeat protein and domain [Sediminibacterium sp.]